MRAEDGGTIHMMAAIQGEGGNRYMVEKVWPSVTEGRCFYLRGRGVWPERSIHVHVFSVRVEK